MKLNVQELKYGAHAVFDTKDEALNYIKKISFKNKSSKDKICMIYRRRKWIVWWE